MRTFDNFLTIWIIFSVSQSLIVSGEEERTVLNWTKLVTLTVVLKGKRTWLEETTSFLCNFSIKKDIKYRFSIKRFCRTMCFSSVERQEVECSPYLLSTRSAFWIHAGLIYRIYITHTVSIAVWERSLWSSLDLTCWLRRVKKRVFWSVDCVPAGSWLFLSLLCVAVAGLPKAAVITHLQSLKAAGGFWAYCATGNDVIYTPLPLYHSAASLVGIGGTIELGNSLNQTF